MFVGVDPDIGPLPRTMNALVHWHVQESGVDVDYFELIHLSLQPPANTWEGHSQNGTYTTSVSVDPTMDPETFTIATTLKTNGVTLSAASWTHRQPATTRRWDTGNLEHIIAPGFNEVQMRLQA